jgi:glycosyltransferase involved in cell wall biosynthesis
VLAGADRAAAQATLASAARHTAPEVRIAVAGPEPPAGPAGRAIAHVPAPAAPAAAAVAACEALAPDDVVLLSGGCIVGPGWLPRLAGAARSDTTVAAASPFASALDAAELERAALRLGERSLRLRPRTGNPNGACVYLRRHALDLAGPLDPEGTLPAALAAFAARCGAAGMQHVLADDVIVAAPEGTAPPGPAPDPLGAAARAERVARVALHGLGVTIDARGLTDVAMGTQVHTLELLAALHGSGGVRLRALVGARLGERARAALERLDGVELVSYDDVAAGRIAPTEVVHRPHQVSSEDDLRLLHVVGERIVVTHHDLIAYRAADYHADRDAFERHRRLTRAALGRADLVVFDSAHACADALADDLVEAQRARIVPIGTDHRFHAAAAARPAWAPAGPFLVCLGADYRHKNRRFALELLERLEAVHGWRGKLVLAGHEVDHGGTSAEDAAWAADHPELGVLLRGPVAEQEKSWLYANAAAVLYPTTYEGFGLIPFEAAAAGTPCAWAAVASLADLLPPERAVLVPWDPAASAAALLPLLDAGPERDAHVAAVRAAGTRLTWSAAAESLLALYEEAVGLPATKAAVAVADARAAEAARGDWEGRYWHLRNEIGPAGLALVGPDEPLLDVDGRRARAALAAKPGGRRALHALLRAARRVGRG